MADRQIWRPILFSCPLTGHTVQGLLSEETFGSNSSNTDRYEPMSCIACSATHFINPVTGVVLGTGAKR
jgi:hypothetical protein